MAPGTLVPVSLGRKHLPSVVRASLVPVEGLYLCGSACHPGPGVTCMPGHNAARKVLGDLE